MTAIIFDFDGTLVNSLEAIAEITNRLALEFGYTPVTPEDILKFKNLTSREVLQQAGISLFQLPFILRKLRAELNLKIPDLHPVTGIQETLAALKKQGHHLGIITTNTEENVHLFLKTNNLDELFSFVYSEPLILGKSRSIRKAITQGQFLPHQVIYVGDETRDIEAAHQTHVKVIAVGWGFNSSAVLAAHHPDFLIHHPAELLTAVDKLLQ